MQEITQYFADKKTIGFLRKHQKKDLEFSKSFVITYFFLFLRLAFWLYCSVPSNKIGLKKYGWLLTS